MTKPVVDLATAAQTVALGLQWIETMKEYDDARETRKQWKSRNTEEYAQKATQRTNEMTGAKTQLDLALANIGLDKKDIGLGKDKVGLEEDRADLGEDKLDIAEDKLALDDQQFDIANAIARTKRDATGATEYAEEEAAGVAGTAVDDMRSYLGSLGARTGEYVDEAKAFTDPLLAAAPGTTVGGSRYGGDFAAASGPSAYARDSRKAEIAAFAAAMGESTNSLSGIDMGKATQGAQQDRINREVGLAGADQSLAAAGLRNEGVKLSGDEVDVDREGLDIDREGLDIDLSALGIDSSRADLNKQLKHSQYSDIFHKLASQGQLDRIAQKYPNTLRGQQFIQFPTSQLMNDAAGFVDKLKTPTTQVSYGTYGSGARNPYGVGTFNPGAKGGAASGGF